MSFGALNENTKHSGRVAPAVFGLGLIEAITEKDLLKNADPEDLNNDGISGRAHKLVDKPSKKIMIGKFGWKATRDIHNSIGGRTIKQHELLYCII